MHKEFMLAAFAQAKLGQGFCAPNPCVGAVAVQNGVIIAQAYHKGAGSPHAEALLLAQLPPNMPGVSVYVTLEPCNHWGKTPPCVDAIIQYGVDQVYYAYIDPNPLVIQSQSLRRLHAEGIQAIHYPLKEIDAFYQSYHYWMHTGYPWVTVKMAQTLDGKIGLNDKRVMLSNDACAQFTHQQRAMTDIILTSAKTIRVDNPMMNARLAGKVQAKPLAILDSHLILSPKAKIFSTASHCRIYHQQQNKLANYPNSTYHFMPVKHGYLDLKAIFKHLGELGYHNVWVESGGALFSALHQQGLVNRTYLYLVPTILGKTAIPAYQQEGILNREHKLSWQSMGNNMIACFDWKDNPKFGS